MIQNQNHKNVKVLHLDDEKDVDVRELKDLPTPKNTSSSSSYESLIDFFVCYSAVYNDSDLSSKYILDVPDGHDLCKIKYRQYPLEHKEHKYALSPSDVLLFTMNSNQVMLEEDDWRKLPKEKKAPTYYAAVLTDVQGNRIYASVVHFYEKQIVHINIPDPNAKNQNIEVQSISVTGIVEMEENQKKARQDEQNKKTNNKNILRVEIYLARALCIVSHYPCISLFKNCLKELLYFQSQFVDPTLPSPQQLLVFLTQEIVLPIPGKHSVTFRFGRERINLRLPSELEFPLLDLSLRYLLHFIPVKTLIDIMVCLLTERQVLMVSSKIERLTLIGDSLIALLFPFRWYHVYMPTLTKHLLSVLQAPVPYFAGIETITFETYVNRNDLEDVYILDIDKGKIVAINNTFSSRSTKGLCLPHAIEFEMHHRLTTILLADYGHLEIQKNYTYTQWKELPADKYESVLLKDCFNEKSYANFNFQIRSVFLRGLARCLKNYKQFTFNLNTNNAIFNIEGFITHKTDVFSNLVSDSEYRTKHALFSPNKVIDRRLIDRSKSEADQHLSGKKLSFFGRMVRRNSNRNSLDQLKKDKLLDATNVYDYRLLEKHKDHTIDGKICQIKHCGVMFFREFFATQIFTWFLEDKNDSPFHDILQDGDIKMDKHKIIASPNNQKYFQQSLPTPKHLYQKELQKEAAVVADEYKNYHPVCNWFDIGSILHGSLEEEKNIIPRKDFSLEYAKQIQDVSNISDNLEAARRSSSLGYIPVISSLVHDKIELSQEFNSIQTLFSILFSSSKFNQSIHNERLLTACINYIEHQEIRDYIAEFISQPNNTNRKRSVRLDNNGFHALHTLCNTMLNKCLQYKEWKSAMAILSAGFLIYVKKSEYIASPSEYELKYQAMNNKQSQPAAAVTAAAVVNDNDSSSTQFFLFTKFKYHPITQHDELWDYAYLENLNKANDKARKQYEQVVKARKILKEEKVQMGFTFVCPKKGVKIPRHDNKSEHHRGLLVVNLQPGGPAEMSGLRVGDTVLKMDDIRTISKPDFLQCIEKSTIGDKVKMVLLRDARYLKRLNVTIGSRNYTPAKVRELRQVAMHNRNMPTQQDLFTRYVIDHSGTLLKSMFSYGHDMDSAKRFIQKACKRAKLSEQDEQLLESLSMNVFKAINLM